MINSYSKQKGYTGGKEDGKFINYYSMCNVYNCCS